jgi:hypothetical protein
VPGRASRASARFPPLSSNSAHPHAISRVSNATIYLPDDLKAALERTAAARGTSEAEIVRSALASATAEHTYPPPKLPLFAGDDPTLAERVDQEVAEGFGE